MPDERLEFYDPLYETIIFERGLPSAKFPEPAKEDPLDPRDLVRTAEFSRLAFLRQAGFAWLVFPSATHTRFAHSIGCWWLGRIAETLIKVKIPASKGRDITLSLKKWLEKTGLREEFYLALLFHDIGHGPFSHVLEHNDAFIAGLESAGVRDTVHEHRGASLLLGTGIVAETWRETAAQRYGRRVRTLGELKEHLATYESLCIDAVCYLMTSDERYLDNCRHAHRDALYVVKELVSGLLDLDRLDHYARDSYFSGLRQVSVNVRGFLSNLRVSIPENGKTDPLLSLTHDGASYAASLLFSKRQITSTMFRNPKTVAFDAMANWALTAWVRSLGDKAGGECSKIAMMEDDQLLESIGAAEHPGCRFMARRIRSIRPYALVGRWQKAQVEAAPNAVRVGLEALTYGLDEERAPRVLVHFDRSFWADSPPEPRDWLDTGHLSMDGTGELLTDHPDHAGDFQFLREAERNAYLWVFAQEEDKDRALKAKVEAILSTGRSS